MKKYNILLLFTSLLLCTLFVMYGCSENLPDALETSSKHTELKSIKLINAGENGDQILVGKIDEELKTVNFPRIDMKTDFSNLKFEVELSEGAKMDKESYSIDFQEGQSSNSLVIKVMNEPRYKEYLVRLRLLIPLFGADFDKPEIYDFSANPAGNDTYPSFSGLATRGTGFDGNHVLILDRGSGGPHLLKVEDLKKNSINKIPLNTTGVSGGTFPYNMGAQINGHTYAASLSTSGTNPLKIYHWTDPSQAPEIIVDLLTGTIGAGARNGDNVSFSIDNNGNGYIYFISMGLEILRFSVQNYTQVSNPTVVKSIATYGQWSSFLQVLNTNQYLLTSNTQPISVVNENASIAYTMSRTSVPVQGTAARVIEFNGERYLMMITTARTGQEVSNILLYDITRGSDIVEALTIFEQNPQPHVFQHNLTSVTNIAPAAQTGYKILKDSEGNDETLILYGAHADAGFAIIELPIKKLEDDF